jgi:hypothetical protein
VTETEREVREAEWQTRWQRNLAYHLRADDARLQAGRNEQFPFQGEVAGAPGGTSSPTAPQTAALPNSAAPPTSDSPT